METSEEQSCVGNGRTFTYGELRNSSLAFGVVLNLPYSERWMEKAIEK
jgi:hypothetical protein